MRGLPIPINVYQNRTVCQSNEQFVRRKPRCYVMDMYEVIEKIMGIYLTMFGMNSALCIG